MTDPDELRPGLPPESTLAAFEAASNKGATRLFITESWFAPFRARLLAALPTDVTEPLIEALRDALYKRRPLETVVEFVEQQPRTWAEFEVWYAERDQQRRLELARRGFFPWPDVEAAAHDEDLQRSDVRPGQARAPAMLRFGEAEEAVARSLR